MQLNVSPGPCVNICIRTILGLCVSKQVVLHSNTINVFQQPNFKIRREISLTCPVQEHFSCALVFCIDELCEYTGRFQWHQNNSPDTCPFVSAA